MQRYFEAKNPVAPLGVTEEGDVGGGISSWENLEPMQ